MQGGELLWRAQQLLLTRLPLEGTVSRLVTSPEQQQYWADSLARFRDASDRPVLLDAQRAQTIARRRPDLVSQVVDKADEAVRGSFKLFGYPEVQLEKPIRWNHDPFADVRWSDMPSHRIDHRTAGGDVKWIWELNRLQHLPVLAEAWLFTRDRRYTEAAFDHLDNWIDQNPPGRGITWRGAFELGLRGISVAIALQGLRDAAELNTWRYQRIVNMLTHSALRCWRDRSRFSSANNHLVGEMAGLAVISMIFPDLVPARNWEERAIRILSDEAGKQILSDGSGAEQSVGYQLATVELLQLVAALLLDRDGKVPKPISGAIGRSAAFLAATVGEHDPDLRYGDSDQEFAIRLGAEEFRSVRDHIGLVTPFDWGKAGSGTGTDSMTAEWYRAVALKRGGGAGRDLHESRFGGSETFYAREGGLVVLRNGQRRTTVDVGPLGYLSIAAHGHADALAVTISEAGQDIIGDPGTGSYYRHPLWRGVMRGTRAHPTVCVDEQDQSVIGGPFLWSRHARARVLGIDLRGGVVDAEHDGYTRLPGRVVHRRWLIAPPQDRSQLVVDLITGAGVHTARTSWPLHPSMDAARQANVHVLRRASRPVMHLLHAASAELVFEDSFGDETRALGWWSDRLEDRVPCWWLSAVCRGELPVVMVTLITPADDVATEELTVALTDETVEARWRENGRPRGASILLAGSAQVLTRS